MKRNAFTLIELLSAMVIIGILSLVAIPSVTKAIKTNRNTLYNVQIEDVINAAKNWATDNIVLLPDNDDDLDATVTYGTLKAGGYIDDVIKNPKDYSKCLTDTSIITISKVDNTEEYNYEFNPNSSNDWEICQ